MKHTFFSRLFSGLLLSAVLAAPAMALAASSSANISVADKPVRIIRGTAVYKAGVGVLAQKEDIVETGAAGAQLEVSPDLILELGPDTRIYLNSIGADGPVRTELALLKGWVKVMAKGSGAAKRLIVTSGSMKVALDSGSSIVHSTAEKSEMFAEEGTQIVNEIDERGKAGADTKVNREQFAINIVGQGLKVLPRPGRDFLSDMPVAFRDPVTPAPDRLKGARSPATKEREADFADVEPWLNNNLPMKKAFVGRFMPRIKDPAFRKQLDEQLGQSAEWKTILHPPPPPAK
ncbi:hypothetical protein ACO0LO_22620 [Undibacterium sp. TJN25]|uniref:hypothetical protein n=1 Tax=Undibacterium sp. TJN25 TaxID=3413056 RepID=UPI003BF39649